MYKIKRFSMASEVLKNAKRQAIKTPITAAGFGITSLAAASNLYNTNSSRKSRKRTIEELEKLSSKNKKKIILQ